MSDYRYAIIDPSRSIGASLPLAMAQGTNAQASEAALELMARLREKENVGVVMAQPSTVLRGGKTPPTTPAPGVFILGELATIENRMLTHNPFSTSPLADVAFDLSNDLVFVRESELTLFLHLYLLSESGDEVGADTYPEKGKRYFLYGFGEHDEVHVNVRFHSGSSDFPEHAMVNHVSETYRLLDTHAFDGRPSIGRSRRQLGDLRRDAELKFRVHISQLLCMPAILEGSEEVHAQRTSDYGVSRNEKPGHDETGWPTATDGQVDNDDDHFENEDHDDDLDLGDDRFLGQ